MNAEDIKKILPHRYPMLLVDGVTEKSEKTITAFKNISLGEIYFSGHFPDYPIWPGVLIIEGLAQSAGLLMMNENEKTIPLFLGIDKARFRNEVRPGDVLTYNVELLNKKMNIYKLKGIAKVGEKICAEAEIMVGVKK